MRTKLLIATLGLFAITSPASAIDRMGFEIVPLQENPLPACNQMAAIAINPFSRLDVVAESPNNYELYVLYKPKNTSPLPASCRANPLLCMSQFLAHPAESRELLAFRASGFPTMEVAVAGIVGQDVVYSPVIDLDFTPCPYTQIARLTPGNGTGPTVSMADRGPQNHPLRTIKPVTKWGSQNHAVMGGSQAANKYYLSILTYTNNIDQVIFNVSSSNGQVGHVVVPGSNATYNPDTGARGYNIELDHTDWSGASTLTATATVVPLIGRPTVMTGVPTTQTQRELDEFQYTIYDNSNNALNARRIFYVGTGGTTNVPSNCTDPHAPPVGSAPRCCGSFDTPCGDMDTAMRSMNRTLNPSSSGPTDISGSILQFKSGTYQFGTLSPYWPGYTATTIPFTVRGSKSTSFHNQTRLNGRTDHQAAGYPSQALLFNGNINYEDINLQNTPGPNQRSYILQSTANPSRFVNVKGIHFRGAGITACAGDTDGISGGLTRVERSTFVDGNFNSNGWHYFLTWIKSFSIAYSEIAMAVNSGATVSQTGETAGPDFPGCTAANTPHGDLIRIASRVESLISSFKTTVLGHNWTQGLFLSNIPSMPNQMQILVQNSYFRIGNGSQGTPGRVALLGNIQHAIFANSTFGLNAPVTHGCFDAATCNSPGFYLIGSNRLFGPDSQTYSSPLQNFRSNISGIYYRDGSGSNPLN